MKWRVTPSGLSGTIVVPPSKSHTIRALLVAVAANGVSTIRRPLTCGDGASALGAARSMGARVEELNGTITVTGIAGDYNAGDDIFDMENSGTSTNLFTSIAALGSRQRTIDGDGSLRLRPVKPLLDALQQLGAQYTCTAPGRDLPFTIQGPVKGGTVTVNGRSSQYVSSLLFACPLMPHDSDIVVENLQEVPYIAMTLWWLDLLGIRYEKKDDYTQFHVYGNQSYHPIDMAIPGDFSSATFPAVAAALTRSSITINGIDFSDPQGDKRIFDILASMGIIVGKHDNNAVVSYNGILQGREIDLNTMPDALPAVAVLGCFAEGSTHIVNVGHARIKETDRIAVMVQELKKMGAHIEEEPTGILIHHSPLHGAQVNGHDDHRVVMALTLAGMCASGETVVDTAEAAAVTYAGFSEDFIALGAHIIAE